MRLEKRALDKLFRRRDRIEIPEFQRGKVWDTSRKQEFIDTIQNNWFVPVVFLRVVDEQRFECIDGQQRLNAIFGFYSNAFPLARKFSKYGGRIYKELPDKIKDVFDDYELYIVEINDAEPGEVEKLFSRLQLGVPLNAGEKLNAISGDMRDFVVELTRHKFLQKKINIKDSRFTFLTMCSQICLLEMNGISDSKFKHLSTFFQNHTIFSKDSPEAKKIIKVFEFLNGIFEHKTPELNNRASIISLYLLASELLKKTSLKGKETTIKEFYISFLKTLSAEVEKGPLATDTDLIIYQSAVNQAAYSKESIQIRQDILMKHLIRFDDTFAQFTEKEAINERLAALENEDKIFNLANDFFYLMSGCNEICTSKQQPHIFKVTNKVLKRIDNVNSPVTTRDDFGNFIDALYEIVYEGSGSLGRIPNQFKNEDSVLFAIKFVRADLRHDLNHGDEKEIASKRKRLAEISKLYSGKTSFSAVDNKGLMKVQMKLLENLVLFLTNLKKFCSESSD